MSAEQQQAMRCGNTKREERNFSDCILILALVRDLDLIVCSVPLPESYRVWKEKQRTGSKIIDSIFCLSHFVPSFLFECLLSFILVLMVLNDQSFGTFYFLF